MLGEAKFSLSFYTTVHSANDPFHREHSINVRSILGVVIYISAHDGRVKERVGDYNKICAGLSLPKSGANSKQTASDGKEVCGFRI